MIVCVICGQPASQSFTFPLGGGLTRTAYYCKNHNPQSRPEGISSEQMRELDPENS